MKYLLALWDMVHHLAAHIVWLVAHYEAWTYLALGVIVFLENGVVLTPFLPGDSLIFVCGSLAAKGAIHPTWLIITLILASSFGAFLNYAVGVFAKPYLESGKLSFIRPAYIEKTQFYFSKYGQMTIFVAKFLPIVRTFAPFLAGVSKMPLMAFAFYNLLGSLVWTFFFVGAGFYFGNIPIIKDNLLVVALTIGCFSVLPIIWKLFRGSRTINA